MRHERLVRFVLLLGVLLSVPLPGSSPAWASDGAERPFWIRAVDTATGRGVPLVRLTTTDQQTFVTDSRGVAAIGAEGLEGETVWLTTTVEGYRFTRQDLGGRPGFRTRVQRGNSVTIRLERMNVAERLYRKTGRERYVHSRRAGRPTPPGSRPLNAGVMGQDSVLGAVYRGLIHWIYGDTKVPESRFGIFRSTGATSRLPADGGLDPAVGVRQRYFADDAGRAKPLMPRRGPGPVWFSRLMVVPGPDGRRLFGYYKRMRPGEGFHMKGHGIARWSPEAQRFRPVRRFARDEPYRVQNTSASYRTTLRVHEHGREWFYFPNPYPTMKVPARGEHLQDPDAYRVFSPLPPDTRFETGPSALKRGASEGLEWGWKKRTAPLTPPREAKLVEEGRLDRSEGIHHLTDVRTGEPIVPGHGSVHWNPYRERWIMISARRRGKTSNLGEIYYAEADSPLGPWVYARKIVTHDSHALYNPTHHPFLDQRDGRTIFFEGTYARTFNENPRGTPRYDYNQIMYRLDLTDTRLILPVPIYREHRGGGARYGPLRRTESPSGDTSTVPFYAYSSDRRPPQSIPVWEETYRRDGDTVTVLTSKPASSRKPGGAPAFYALADTRSEDPLVEPLYRYRSVRGSEVLHRTPSTDPGVSWRRSEEPVAHVWRSPRLDPPRNPDARPILSCVGSSAHCPGGPGPNVETQHSTPQTEGKTASRNRRPPPP